MRQAVRAELACAAEVWHPAREHSGRVHCDVSVSYTHLMLIVLQHNVAHLGIVTGLCLSEAATKYTPSWVSRPILGTAVLASISTSLAEILGGAIALQMLFDIPIIWGSILTTVFVVVMLFTN